MTKVKVTVNKFDLLKITIDGHTNFAVHGEDIVCASISSISFSVINFLKDNDAFAYTIDDETTFIAVEQIKQDEQVSTFLSYLTLSFENIAKQYPEFIKIEVRSKYV